MTVTFRRGHGSGPSGNPAPSQQQCESGKLPPPPLIGAMALQTGFAMQAGQSYPQQLVQLVGHRHCGAAAWVRPRAKVERP